MEAFTRLHAVAAPLDEMNLDTNQLCPSRFNKTVVGPGYERVLFHDRRFNADGSEKPDFVLNRKPYRQAKILVGSRNFGCGSSRETAVTALLGFGIRVVIAPEFADIFHNNALKNGLLPVVLDAGTVRDLQTLLTTRPGSKITVDLEALIVQPDDEAPIDFTIDSLVREKLLLGLDDIDMTERVAPDLRAFEASYRRVASWMPVRGPGE
jgi:3-isopropylmalate/(R)-2-methylmalate dehydratase small subunit